MWVKPKGSLCWTKDSPTWDSVVTCGLNSASGFIYALPATLDGYELVKVGEVIPDGSMSMVKGNPKCFGTSFCTGHAVKKNDGNWHFRPIAAPVAEPVKCPYCASTVSVKFDDGRAYGACFDCDYTTPTRDSTAEIVSLIKRTTVAPEPLRCPCGGTCSVQTREKAGHEWQSLSSCGIRGKIMDTKEQAESEFRKLAYGGAK